MEIDLEPLRVEIRKRKLMKLWGETLDQKCGVERKIEAQNKALEAKDTYIRIMNSAKNDGSADYQEWAIRKALGLLKQHGYTAQAIGGKHWKGWGKEEES